MPEIEWLEEDDEPRFPWEFRRPASVGTRCLAADYESECVLERGHEREHRGADGRHFVIPGDPTW
jgi:hypothetical protein